MRALKNQELLRAKAFADLTGVSVRTLHLYDNLGLLAPAERGANGYRLYGERELLRLEQILALRFLGLGLDRIKTLLDGPPHTLTEALDVQRALLVEEARRVHTVLEAIDEAQRALEGGERDQWQVIQRVIEALKMKNDSSWTERYYSPEALEKLAQIRATTPPEVIERGQNDWAALIAEVEHARTTCEPSSERAQELARRWSELVNAFTRGDAQITDGLTQLWNDSTHWPKDFKKPYSDEAEAFIRAAQAHRQSRDTT